MRASPLCSSGDGQTVTMTLYPGKRRRKTIGGLGHLSWYRSPVRWRHTAALLPLVRLGWLGDLRVYYPVTRHALAYQPGIESRRAVVGEVIDQAVEARARQVAIAIAERYDRVGELLTQA